MIKVLMFNYEYPPLGGGAANATKNILEKFSTYEDLEIDLITSSTGKFRIEKLGKKKNVRIHFLDIGKEEGKLLQQSSKDLIKYTMKAISYGRKLKKQRKYDLSHAFFAIPCGYIPWILNIPYIASLRGADVPGNNPKFDKINKIMAIPSRRVWRKAKFMVANSDDLKKRALMCKYVDEVGNIPNGVNCDKFKPSFTKTGKDLKLFYVGRLHAVKNIDTMIKVIAETKDTTLTLVGDGAMDQELKDLAKELGVEKRVHFLGRKTNDEVAKMYKNFDAYIQISIHEGMSNSILEAMASGLPLILSNTGGVKTLVKGNGYVVPTKNVKKIASVVNELKSDVKRLNMSKKSRKIAEGMSWDNVAKEYYELYKEV